MHGAPAYGRYPTRSTAGNALAAHTRSEIDSDGLDNAENDTCVGFGGLLAGPNGCVVISLVCRKHAGRTHTRSEIASDGLGIAETITCVAFGSFRRVRMTSRD